MNKNNNKSKIVSIILLAVVMLLVVSACKEASFTTAVKIENYYEETIKNTTFEFGKKPEPLSPIEISNKQFQYWFAIIGNKEVILTNSDGVFMSIWKFKENKITIKPKYTSAFTSKIMLNINPKNNEALLEWEEKNANIEFYNVEITNQSIKKVFTNCAVIENASNVFSVKVTAFSEGGAIAYELNQNFKKIDGAVDTETYKSVFLGNDSYIQWQKKDFFSFEVLADESTVIVNETKYPIKEQMKNFAVRGFKVADAEYFYFSDWAPCKAIQIAETEKNYNVIYKENRLSFSNPSATQISVEVTVNKEKIDFKTTKDYIDFDAISQAKSSNIQVVVTPLGKTTGNSIILDGKSSQVFAISYLEKVTGLKIKNGQVEWDRVEMASSYDLKIDYLNSSYEINKTEEKTVANNNYNQFNEMQLYSISVKANNVNASTYSVFSEGYKLYVVESPSIDLGKRTEENKIGIVMQGKDIALGYNLVFSYENKENIENLTIDKFEGGEKLQSIDTKIFIKPGDYFVSMYINQVENIDTVEKIDYLIKKSNVIKITKLAPIENVFSKFEDGNFIENGGYLDVKFNYAKEGQKFAYYYNNVKEEDFSKSEILDGKRIYSYKFNTPKVGDNFDISKYELKLVASRGDNDTQINSEEFTLSVAKYGVANDLKLSKSDTYNYNFEWTKNEGVAYDFYLNGVLSKGLMVNSISLPNMIKLINGGKQLSSGEHTFAVRKAFNSANNTMPSNFVKLKFVKCQTPDNLKISADRTNLNWTTNDSYVSKFAVAVGNVSTENELVLQNENSVNLDGYYDKILTVGTMFSIKAVGDLGDGKINGNTTISIDSDYSNMTLSRLPKPTFAVNDGKIKVSRHINANKFVYKIGEQSHLNVNNEIDILTTFILNSQAYNVSVIAQSDKVEIFDSESADIVEIIRLNKPTLKMESSLFSNSATIDINADKFKLVIKKGNDIISQNIHTGFNDISADKFKLASGDYVAQLIAWGNGSSTLNSPQSDEYDFIKLASVEATVNNSIVKMSKYHNVSKWKLNNNEFTKLEVNEINNEREIINLKETTLSAGANSVTLVNLGNGRTQINSDETVIAFNKLSTPQDIRIEHSVLKWTNINNIVKNRVSLSYSSLDVVTDSNSTNIDSRNLSANAEAGIESGYTAKIIAEGNGVTTIDSDVSSVYSFIKLHAPNISINNSEVQYQAVSSALSYSFKFNNQSNYSQTSELNINLKTNTSLNVGNNTVLVKAIGNNGNILDSNDSTTCQFYKIERVKFAMQNSLINYESLTAKGFCYWINTGTPTVVSKEIKTYSPDPEGNLSAGEYTLSVVAHGDGVQYIDSEISQFVFKKHNAVNISMLNSVLSWNAITDASKYKLTLKGQNQANATNFEQLSISYNPDTTGGLIADDYNFSVVAVGNGVSTLSSNASNFSFEKLQETALTIENSKVVWNPINSNLRYEIYLNDVKFSESEITELNLINKSISVGSNSIKVKCVADGKTKINSNLSSSATFVKLASPEVAMKDSIIEYSSDNARGYYFWLDDNMPTLIGKEIKSFNPDDQGQLSSGVHNFNIKAVGDGVQYIDSEIKTFSFSKLVISNITMQNSIISWVCTGQTKFLLVLKGRNQEESSVIEQSSSTFIPDALGDLLADTYDLKVVAIGNGTTVINSLHIMFSFEKLPASDVAINNSSASWNSVANVQKHQVFVNNKMLEEKTNQQISLVNSLIASGDNQIKVKNIANGRTAIDSSFSQAVSFVKLNKPSISLNGNEFILLGNTEYSYKIDDKPEMNTTQQSIIADDGTLAEGSHKLTVVSYGNGVDIIQSESSVYEFVKLAKVVDAKLSNNKIIIWQALPNASGYQVSVNENSYVVNNTNYTPSLSKGQYVYKIKALPVSGAFIASDFIELTINKEESLILESDKSNNKIFWNKVNDIASYKLYLNNTFITSVLTNEFSLENFKFENNNTFKVVSVPNKLTTVESVGTIPLNRIAKPRIDAKSSNNANEAGIYIWLQDVKEMTYIIYDSNNIELEKKGFGARNNVWMKIDFYPLIKNLPILQPTYFYLKINVIPLDENSYGNEVYFEIMIFRAYSSSPSYTYFSQPIS